MTFSRPKKGLAMWGQIETETVRSNVDINEC